MAFYVSPTGSSSNPGTEASPWSLAYALAGAGGAITPGALVVVGGGRYELGSAPLYAADCVTGCAGTASKPVIFRGASPLPWQMPVICGALTIEAAHTWWWDLRFTWDFDTDRVSASAGSPVADVPRQGAQVAPEAANVRLINVVMNDMGGGFSGFSLSPALTVDDCVSYNNGWIGSDRGHGHGFYMQSTATPSLPADMKRVRNLVSFSNFGANGKLGGSDAVSNLIGFEYDGCTFFDPGLPVEATFLPEPNFICDGASTRKGNITLTDSTLWMRDGGFYDYTSADAPWSLWLGDNNEGANPVTVDNVRIQGRMTFGNWSGATFTDNTVTAGDDALPWTLGRALVQLSPTPSPYSKYTWDRNRYAHTGDARIMLPVSSMQNLASWQSTTGYDATSTHTVGELTTAEADVVRSVIDPDRATITIWNQGGDASVNVDVSSVLRSGDTYALYHIYDWVGGGSTTLSGVYSGVSLTVPMSERTPPTPQGWTSLPSLPNTFGVFVLRRITTGERMGYLDGAPLDSEPLDGVQEPPPTPEDPTATGVSPTRRGLFRGRTRRGR